jgi:hypothetical protein
MSPPSCLTALHKKQEEIEGERKRRQELETVLIKNKMQNQTFIASLFSI